MKQVLQNLGSGETELVEIPSPRSRKGELCIETSTSLVSLGTEKMLLDFGKANLIDKARQQPDKVKQVLQKIKTDGLFSTLDAVKAKLDVPIPLGYSNVGRVCSISNSQSPNSNNYDPGTRVVSNGPHAELVSVPENLCARIPDTVTDEQAVFTVVGAIGLQGIRLLHPTLGERIVVSGLGLIGLLCVQMLRAQGCQVLGIDLDEKKLELARKWGAVTVNLAKGEDAIAVADNWTRGQGVDGVLITASAKSDEVVHQAATMCRKRGRIVLVGVVGLNLRRSDFYEKELSFQVSCSYGPGRYDPNYEKKGLDYPIGFVRWTEQRNFEAVLQLMADGKLDIEPLISHRFKFDDALQAYETVSNDPSALGIILRYDQDGPSKEKLNQFVSFKENRHASQKVGAASKIEGARCAFVGAGAFATRMLLPHFKGLDVELKTVVSSGGLSANHAARKFGFANASTDVDSVLQDEEIDAVFITTPHHVHAGQVLGALKAGKHVFVEKPLCMTLEELEDIKAAYGKSESQLMVGFNRRFSPHTRKIKSALESVKEPKSFIMTVNAGAIPKDHWTQDPEVGGGRVIGEACHFIDLLRFLAASPIKNATADYQGGHAGRLGDVLNISLTFEDGSIGTIHYLANGHKSFPKERLEVFAGGRVIQCDNFRKTVGFGVPGLKKFKTRSQDKGHKGEVKAFVDAIKNGTESPIPAEEIFEVMEVTLELANQQ